MEHNRRSVEVVQQASNGVTRQLLTEKKEKVIVKSLVRLERGSKGSTQTNEGRRQEMERCVESVEQKGKGGKYAKSNVGKGGMSRGDF